MARPRKPTALLELNGSLARNKKRHAGRANEPHPTVELGNAPSYLQDDEKKAWRQIRKRAFWLTDAEADLVEGLSMLLAKMRRREFTKVSDFVALGALLGRLGMSPTDRSKVQMPAKEEKDPFASFMEDLGADDPEGSD